MQIDQSIFKAYDFRGIYPTQLNEEIMERIGRAFVEFLDAKEVLVGWDMRLSSEALKNAFTIGATKQGAKVIQLGMVTTDALYFASGKYNLPGVMITASHNPKDYNGVKFCRAMAAPVSQDTGLLDIKEKVLRNEFVDAPVAGSVEERVNTLEAFSEHCFKFVDKDKIKPLKIAIDTGNGMAGKLLPIVLKSLPCKIEPLYFELDGNFPNHQPSPIEKANNLDLIAKIKELKFDLGLAFDGDGDRVFFFDENGEMLDSSFITAMIAKKLLEKNPGGKVIYTVVVSHAVPDLVRSLGGEALLSRVGHSYIKDLMKTSDAIFAGEHSGHYYFRDNFRADSGVIAALIVMEMLSESEKKMSELIREFQTYYKIEETNSKVENAAEIINKIKEKFRANITQEFDGVTFDFGDWWFNVRSSNTEPLLRLNLEAKDKKVMAKKTVEILRMIRAQVQSLKVKVKSPEFESKIFNRAS